MEFMSKSNRTNNNSLSNIKHNHMDNKDNKKINMEEEKRSRGISPLLLYIKIEIHHA